MRRVVPPRLLRGTARLVFAPRPARTSRGDHRPACVPGRGRRDGEKLRRLRSGDAGSRLGVLERTGDRRGRRGQSGGRKLDAQRLRGGASGSRGLRELERLGATGWSWEAVRPHYRRVESEVPIRVYAPESWQPIEHAFVEGFIELGFRPVSDVTRPSLCTGSSAPGRRTAATRSEWPGWSRTVRPARPLSSPSGRPCARRSRADLSGDEPPACAPSATAAARDRGEHSVVVPPFAAGAPPRRSPPPRSWPPRE